jgi:hypothetical protein
VHRADDVLEAGVLSGRVHPPGECSRESGRGRDFRVENPSSGPL